VLNLGSYPLNHKAQLVPGVLGEECAELLRAFFRARRNGSAGRERRGGAPEGESNET
jgi:hypothetical protein